MNPLYYQQFGEKNRSNGAVILLHGLFGMSDNLTGLARQLSEFFYVLVPDLVNHGKSPHHAQMDYTSMAQDVFHLMDELQLPVAKICGHSMGGKVAMQMALLQADRVVSLVVADIAPVEYAPRHLEIMAALTQVSSGHYASRKEVEMCLANAQMESGLIPFFLKNMTRDAEGYWRWLFGLSEIIAAYPALSAAPHFSKPYAGNVLFIKGDLSNYILPEHESDVREMFSHAALKVIQGAGHWLHAEKPQAFNRLVMQFFSQNP
jgi:esterase